jgi:integrase
MAIGKLSDNKVKQAKHSGKSTGDKLTDGSGLYLLITASGKYWRMDYQYADKRKTLAIGVYPRVMLAQARVARDEAKALLAQNIDPMEAKRQSKLENERIVINDFEALAHEWMAKICVNQNPETQKRKLTWLKNDVFPYIGKMPIASITAQDMLNRVLRKIEARGAIETTYRVLHMCGEIFRFASVQGLASGDVTANLKSVLTVQKTVTHHAAITEPDVLGELLRAIETYKGQLVTGAALKLAPLVFVRPGELRSAQWSEIDLRTAQWRIPGKRMKMKIDHIVPLSKQAIEIFHTLQPITGNKQYVFSSPSLKTKPIGETTLQGALHALGYDQSMHTVHGFRATARTIMDEVLGERVDLIEHQLAHRVIDANGRAYNRTAHLPARTAMMQRWSDYLDTLRSSVKECNADTANASNLN